VFGKRRSLIAFLLKKEEKRWRDLDLDSHCHIANFESLECVCVRHYRGGGHFMYDVSVYCWCYDISDRVRERGASLLRWRRTTKKFTCEGTSYSVVASSSYNDWRGSLLPIWLLIKG
jgi:hypothetical protein